VSIGTPLDIYRIDIKPHYWTFVKTGAWRLPCAPAILLRRFSLPASSFHGSGISWFEKVDGMREHISFVKSNPARLASLRSI
jgi:hypothetical protein